MTRPYSIAFKQKMVDRLTGKNALSAVQLAQESGIRQQNLSRWLREARSLPFVASDNRMDRSWTVEQKARVVAESSKLAGDQLTAYPRGRRCEARRLRALADRAGKRK